VSSVNDLIDEGYSIADIFGEDYKTDLAALLEEAREFFRRHVVVDDIQADAVALWIAHTFVFEMARATPYIYFCSPDPGSGKTTALEVLAELCARAISIDDISGAALFRLIEADSPTVLLDEVDGVFGKKTSDVAEDHRKLLNSGYRKGKQAIRCGGRNNTELQRFNIFCPKSLGGLRELPGTLAHRSITISMKPPRPTDLYEDFDPEETEVEAAALRARFEFWAESAEAELRDPRLKPVKLPELDARGNEIWRILFRIADLAGARWPDAARDAARGLSAGDSRAGEASTGIKLLGDISGLFDEERESCASLVEALNDDEEMPYGGWNSGAGITTRELGRKLAPYGIRAQKIRFGDRTLKGYYRTQFEDAWARYLPSFGSERGTGEQMAQPSQKTAKTKGEHLADVPLLKNGPNPHGYAKCSPVPLSKPEIRAAQGRGTGFRHRFAR
jgi:Protein of unknown function (DUF3631)